MVLDVAEYGRMRALLDNAALPFGFTQEDVDDEIATAETLEKSSHPPDVAAALRHRHRAAKIAALLPPAP